jgi:hypothetical protein
MLSLLSQSADQKPLLALKMKKKRLQFCRAYKDRTEEDWANAMFRDVHFPVHAVHQGQGEEAQWIQRFDPRTGPRL